MSLLIGKRRRLSFEEVVMPLLAPSEEKCQHDDR